MIYHELKDKVRTISITGLGYVGLPLALHLAKHFSVIGFDLDQEKIDQLNRGIDPNRELSEEDLTSHGILFTSNSENLKEAQFHIIAVPTDVDENMIPDLSPLEVASRSIGKSLKPGDFVVYESTVYPGCTEDFCLPILLDESGLVLDSTSGLNQGFYLGYSPERLSPGNPLYALTKVMKVVSGNSTYALDVVASIYEMIVSAGVFRASSIKVAEAAKVVENTQRDINISLINELAIIFDKAGISTQEVIETASTKWNFHTYKPGLVGGHCISVDPYYLLHFARQLGHEPQLIAAGREVNDHIPHFITKKILQALIEHGKNPGESRILVMGVTFKENVSDIRKSKVVDLVQELLEYSIEVQITDPLADERSLKNEFGLTLTNELDENYDAIVLAVGHDDYKNLSKEYLDSISNGETLVFDIDKVLETSEFDYYWQL